MQTKKKSGQVLILVLLVVVVSLAIGLSVASRNLTNLKISTQTEQSQRAYTVAENGVERVLAQLGNLKSSINSAGAAGYNYTGPADSSSTAASVNIVSNSSYERAIVVGEVGQVDVSSGATIYNIMWAKSPSECTPPASLEITLVYDSGSSVYKQKRWYLLGESSSTHIEPASSSDSTQPTPLGSGVANSNFTYVPASGCTANVTPSCASGVYVRCATIDTSVAGFSPAIGTRKILRIRPLWTDATVNVAGTNLGGLPAQQYDITSTSTVGVGGTSRKLKVTRSVLPTLPAVFDFAFYSETGINK